MKGAKTYTAVEIEADVEAFSRKMDGMLKACPDIRDLGVIVSSFRVDRKTGRYTVKGGQGGSVEARAAMVASMILGNPDISAKALAIVNHVTRSRAEAGKKAEKAEGGDGQKTS